MLKKYLLGGSSVPVAGDGCYVLPAHASKKSSVSTRSISVASVSSGQSTVELQIDQTPAARTSIEQVNNTSTPAEESHSAPAIAAPRIVDVNAWKDFGIPSELALSEGVPTEIANIVRESLDHHEALRLSRQAEPQNGDGETTEDSALAPTESLPISTASKSSFNRSQESVTTVESSANMTTIDAMPAEPSKKNKIRKRDKRFTLLSPSNSQTAENQSLSPTQGHNPFRRFRLRRSSPHAAVPPQKQPTFECTSCFDEIQDYVSLNCTHKYCRECFVSLVQAALTTESLWPPKCCLTEIPRPLMRKYLPVDDVQLFDEKALEYAVPVEHRYYCISPQCGSFIDTRIARQTGTNLLQCRKCSTQICSMCRGQPHPGNNECPQDYGLLATLEISEMEGWRRCYACQAIVELNTGCRHITCRCGAQFCYTCGAIWHTCHCSEESQRRRERDLAAARARREAEALAEQEEIRRAIEAVAEAERQLREEREAAEAREQERLQQEAAELARLESERLIRIAERYTELRPLLRELCEKQKQAIEGRHLKEEDEMDGLRLEFDQKVADQAEKIKADKGDTEAINLKKLKDLRKRQASALMELITRHRNDQDRILTGLVADDANDVEVQQACALEELLPQQAGERAALKRQHATEVETLQQDGQRAINSLKLDVRIQRMKFEMEEQMMTRIDRTNRRQEADMKWFELIQADRQAMLADDERNLIDSGRDVSVGDTPGADTP